LVFDYTKAQNTSKLITLLIFKPVVVFLKITLIKDVFQLNVGACFFAAMTLSTTMGCSAVTVGLELTE